MKAVLLAGGYGRRMADAYPAVPKPMIAIGGRPLLWHIMQIYAHYGVQDFIVCAGFGQQVIHDYFSPGVLPGCHVTVADTGLDTTTAGRILRVRELLADAPFFLTYGDGVADINIQALLDFHQKQQKAATITVVLETPHFGAVELGETGLVTAFREKNPLDSRRINGGFMVFEPAIFDYLTPEAALECAPMTSLVQVEQLAGYAHDGFWQCMDTPQDKQLLEELWNGGNAPWKVW
ncbi:MAG: NTP transferase domain-containing protein [Oscillospiraceae bacterium]|jgi:glucose-1-phosphate cytidylyltransferase|nr:NTP transferase domain-containing protein [Oscillospiraceae bacterium]